MTDLMEERTPPVRRDTMSAVLEVSNDMRSEAVHSWTLLSPISYSTVYLAADGGDREPYVFRVPAGARTDFASIPRPLWWIAAPWGRHGRAGILHDYAYRQGEIEVEHGDGRVASCPIARNEADYLFFSSMMVLDELYDEAADQRPVDPRAKGGPAAVARLVARTTYPLVRLFMTLAVVCFGWLAYKGDTRSPTGPLAVAATVFSAVGTIGLTWWLLGRLLTNTLGLGPVAEVGLVGVASMMVALVLVRLTVHRAQATLRRRLQQVVSGEGGGDLG